MIDVLLRAVIDADFFNHGCFVDQRILIIGGARYLIEKEKVYPEEFMYRYCLEQGAAVCERAILFYENPHQIQEGEYTGSFAGLDKVYEQETFDRVIVLSGLEWEDDPLQAMQQIRKLVRTGGKLDFFLQTPKITYVNFALDEYEHKWRFSLDDLKKIFINDIWIKSVRSTDDNFIVCEIEKSSGEFYQKEIPLFSCKLQRYAMPNEAANSGYFCGYKGLKTLGDGLATDKNQYYHNYLDKYEFFLQPWRDKRFCLLELGIYRGDSARLWERYFPLADIHCVDIVPECASFATERIKPHIMDLGDEENLKKLRNLHSEIIIDDASHWWNHQILALFTLFPSLPSGGVYILEDLETSVNQDIYPDFSHGIDVDAYTVCQRIAKVVAGKVPEEGEDYFSRNISSIGLTTEMVSVMKGGCVFIKR